AAEKETTDFSANSAVVRKNVAPASSRQTVLLTQKELSRLTCRRDAGATILSHDPRLCGEIFWLRLCGAREFVARNNKTTTNSTNFHEKRSPDGSAERV